MPKPKALIQLSYEAYAQEYLRSLPLEHFMEARNLATQRKIFVASMELVTAERSDVHVFNEMLIQYKRIRRRRPGQVVPDNFVSVTREPIQAQTSYNVPLEPVGPFWVLEYVSQSNKRKDYEDNFDKYERELKVPYYLLFYHDIQDLTLYRHDGTKYVSVMPNEAERYAIPELEIEMALIDGWARFWFRGQLLPLPADLLRELEAVRRQLLEVQHQAAHQKERTEAMERDLAEKEQALQAAEAEIARLRAQLERQEKPRNS
jgi:Uma2 family endonuclease